MRKMCFHIALIAAVLAFACAATASMTLTNDPANIHGKYVPFVYTASGTGNTLTILQTGALLKTLRIPYAVEWIDGTTPPSYPLTVAMTCGAWSLTWTLAADDQFQFYYEASGDSGSPPTINADVSVTVTADGESSGGLGSGGGTLRLIFW